MTARAARARTDPEGPARRCIATGEVRPVAELVRFAIGPDGEVVPDVTGRLPGRGLWVSASAPAVAKAVARGAFARAAKRQVAASPDLPDRVRDLLARRVLDLLGLARKAGLAAAGHAKVEAAAARGPVALLFVARDAGAEGRRNAESLAARTGAPVMAAFSAEELGLALGRPNVVHAALTAGGPGKSSNAPDRARDGGRLAGLVLDEVRRLRGFLEEVPR